MSKDPDNKFITQARQLLDRSVDEMESDTAHRLAAARKNALAGSSKQRALPLAMAASLVLAVATVALLTSRTQPALDDRTIEDMAMLGASEEPGLYEEIDFYLWLEGMEKRG